MARKQLPTKAAKNGKSAKRKHHTLPTAPPLAFEPSYMEKTHFVDVQSALGPQKKRLAVIWELKKSAELYLFLKGGEDDIEDRLYNLVLPERLMAKLRAADGESYTLPGLSSILGGDDTNVEVRYNYMISNWDRLSEGHTALQLEKKKFLSYSSFIQNVTRFRKICVHYCLFLFHCRKPIDEICQKFDSCKKIVDIDRKMQRDTLHWKFASKTLKFTFQEPPPPDSDDDSTKSSNSKSKKTTSTTEKTKSGNSNKKNGGGSSKKGGGNPKKDAANPKKDDPPKKKDDTQMPPPPPLRRTILPPRASASKGKDTEKDKAADKNTQAGQKRPAEGSSYIGRLKLRKIAQYTHEDWIYVVKDRMPQGRLTIDLTGDTTSEEAPSQKPQRVSEKLDVSDDWIAQQLNIIKTLTLLKVHLTFSEDLDMIPKPCEWMEWFNEMDRTDNVAEGNSNENLRCWRAIMTLILSRVVLDEDFLKTLVFAMYGRGLFTPEKIGECTMETMSTVLDELKVPDFSKMSKEMKQATEQVLQNPNDRHTIYQQQTLKYSEGQSSGHIHVVKIAMALGWVHQPATVGPETQFALYQKAVQEQLRDWLPEKYLIEYELDTLLPKIGQFMTQVASFAKLKKFISDQLGGTSKEKKATTGIIVKIGAFYESVSANVPGGEVNPGTTQDTTGHSTKKPNSDKEVGTDEEFNKELDCWYAVASRKWDPNDGNCPSKDDTVALMWALLPYADDNEDAESQVEELFFHYAGKSIQGAMDIYKTKTGSSYRLPEKPPPPGGKDATATKERTAIKVTQFQKKKSNKKVGTTTELEDELTHWYDVESPGWNESDGTLPNKLQVHVALGNVLAYAPDNDDCKTQIEELFGYLEDDKTSLKQLMEWSKDVTKYERDGRILSYQTIEVDSVVYGKDESHGYLKTTVRSSRLVGKEADLNTNQKERSICFIPFEKLMEREQYPEGCYNNVVGMNDYIKSLKYECRQRLPLNAGDKAIVYHVLDDKYAGRQPPHISFRASDMGEPSMVI